MPLVLDTGQKSADISKEAGASKPTSQSLSSTESLSTSSEGAWLRDRQFRKFIRELRHSAEVDPESSPLDPTKLGDAITTLTLNLAPSQQVVERCHQLNEALASLDQSRGVLSAAEQLAGYLQQSYSSLSPARALKSISSFGALGQWLHAMGELYDRDIATPWQVVVLTHTASILAAREPQPLIRMALVAARISLQETDSIRSISIAEMSAFGQAPREQSHAEHLTSRHVEKLFSCDRIGERQLTLRRVSSDILAVSDRTTLQPLAYAKFDPAVLECDPRTPIPPMTIRDLLDSPPTASSRPDEKLSWLLRIEEQIIKPLVEYRVLHGENHDRLEQIESEVRSTWGPLLRKDSWTKGLLKLDRALQDLVSFTNYESLCKADKAAEMTTFFDTAIKQTAQTVATSDPLLSEILRQYDLEPDVQRRATLISSILETPQLSELCDWASDAHDHSDSELHTDIMMDYRHKDPSAHLRSLVSRIDNERWDTIAAGLIRRLENLQAKVIPHVTHLKTHEYAEILKDSSLLPFTSVDPGPNGSDVIDIVRALDDPETRTVLERNLHLDLNVIPRASQIQLFRFLADCNQEQFDNVRECFQRHREITPLLARAMISYAEKREASLTLVTLASNMPTHELRQTLDGFLRISDAASMAEDMVRRRGVEMEHAQELTERVRERTLSRANRLLESWGKMLCSDINTKHAAQPVFITLANQLEGESVIFAALFKEALSKNTASLDKLPEVAVRQCYGGTISEEDAARMRTIHEYNGRQLYPAEFAQIVNNAFEESLEDAQSRFYLLRINGVVEGFARFVDEKPGRKYFGSFNVSPALESFGLGGRFLEEMLEHEGRDCQIRLLVSDNNPFRGAYQSRYRFQVTETTENCDLGEALDSPSGVTVHEMVRYPPSE